MIHGIDVSNWQGAVDWASHAGAGARFAFAKATEGLTYTDTYFARNWHGIRAHGLVRGAYHFAHPANGPTAEAKYFLDAVGARGLQDGDLLALDLEVTDGRSAARVAAWARTWCAYVADHAERAPLVYTYRSFGAAGATNGLGRYPLWIADPDHGAGHPHVPAPWSGWAIHQYSTSGGIDRDVSHLTAAQLRALTGDDMLSKRDIFDAVWRTDQLDAPSVAAKGNEHWQGESYLHSMLGRIAKIERLIAAGARKAGIDDDDVSEIVAGVLDGLDPSAIAAAIPDDLASQVADELAKRLRN